VTQHRADEARNDAGKRIGLLWQYIAPIFTCTIAVPSLSLVDNFSMESTIKGSLYSITERRVPELIPVLGRQPAGRH